MLCNNCSEKYYWSNIALTLQPGFHHNADSHKMSGIQCHVLITPFLYTPIQPTHCFDEYTFSLCETKCSDNISKMYLCGEEPKPDID